MSEEGTFSPNTPLKVPSFSEVEKQLSFVVANVMVAFSRMGVDGFTINSVGRVLSQLKFGKDSMSQAEVQAIVNTEAQAQHEQIKLHLLRSSIENDQLN